MTPFILLIAVIATILLAIFVRAFWVEILVVWTILRILYYITGISFVCALLWTFFLEDNMKKFALYWTYFGIAGIIVTTVFYLIVLDVIGFGIQFIRDIFKIK